VREFSKSGIVVEQCAIAAEIFDIPQEDFIPEVKVVGNGYISLVGYQAQGYSVVPMD
jgi:intracellular sulfur oxidation DsrE/DsrF family protein